MADSFETLTHALDVVDQAIIEYVRELRSGEDDPVVAPFGRLSEWPSAVIQETGRPYAIVIGEPGGPHIEVRADGALPAQLCGYWASASDTRHDSCYDVILDFFIDRSSTI